MLQNWRTRRMLGLILLISAITVNTLFAQESMVIKGVVKDATGETLPGVSIKVKNGTAATQTGMNGDYSIKVLGSKRGGSSWLRYPKEE